MKRKTAAALTLLTILAALPVTSASAAGIEDIYKIGDVDLDGVIAVNDASEIQKILAGFTVPGEEQLVKADADYDGKITINDATLIQKMTAGLYHSLAGKKGVDISEYNGDVDMSKIKNAGFEFVMIRCGCGSDISYQDDDCFSVNVKKCEEAGMPWGVYLFSYATCDKDAYSEVAHVDRLLKAEREKGYLPTMPVALDVEWSGWVENHGGWNYKNINNITTIFLDGITNLGYYPILYTGYQELDEFMSPYIRESYDCWFAQWYTSPNSYHYDHLGMWQYGGEENFLESNSIDGVGVTDKNVSYRDYPLIIKNGGYNGWR